MDAAGATLLFHRHELMHAWADAGQIDLERATCVNRPTKADELHACLAAEQAHAILEGARCQALR